MVDDQHDNDDLSIAIIGLDCCFGEAKNKDDFWEYLINGQEALKKEIFDYAEFDAGFFGYSTAEAELIDPQQRLLLQSAYHALEDAAYGNISTPQNIGVFCGVGFNDYLYSNLSGSISKIDASAKLAMLLYGNSPDYLATRIAYQLNLIGPALTLQTACSTSLVAVHLACQSLLTYQCDMALAGAVALITEEQRVLFSGIGGMLSPHHQCRAFDEAADGTVFGSGLGMVVLKRLSEARKDRDHIYAVIKGSAVNNDGQRKIAFSAPSVDGQIAVIQAALDLCEITPESISYIETHGTGTPLGDLIEFSALSALFPSQGDNKCALGSVKTNFGHTLAAAGMAGLVKTTLQLKNRQLVPSLHYKKPNTKINFQDSHFYVNTILKHWRSETNMPLRAGVSSFGIGGTNAHLILEEAPRNEFFEELISTESLLVLSAKSADALKKMEKSLLRFCQNNAGIQLTDLAYSLQVGRAGYQHRSSLLINDISSLINQEKNFSSHHSVAVCQELIFMLATSSVMKQNVVNFLYHSEPIFKEYFDICAKEIMAITKIDVTNFLVQHTTDNFHNQELSFYKFVTDYALVSMLMAWGIKPTTFIGFTGNELLTLSVASVISITDAVKRLFFEDYKLEPLAQKLKYNVMLVSSNVLYLAGEIIESIDLPLGDTLTVSAGEKFKQYLGIFAKKPTANFVQIGGLSVDHALIKSHAGVFHLALSDCNMTHLILMLIEFFWLRLIPFDWHQYYRGKKRNRLSLPTYPFAASKYYIKKSERIHVSEEGLQLGILQSNDVDNPAVEHVLHEFFKEVLGLDEISSDADFFELGGHSLLASQLIARINQTYSCQLQFDQIYDYPTINALVEFIKNYGDLG